MLRWLARPAERCLGRGGGGGGGGGGRDGLLWHAELKPHASGEYSIAVAQANAKLEDQGQVVTSPAATFVGVYDGHGGPEASRFLSSRLFPHLHRFASEQGGMSIDAIKRAFHVTEEEFLHLVKGSWLKQPQIEALVKLHIYVLRSHVLALCQIKVSRSIGDIYLKKPEFARDPIFRQCVCPIPLKRPVMTAEPSIKEHQLRQQDLFLIFASDGLWEQLTDKAAVDIVFKNPRAGIAKRLVRAALTEAARKREMRYTDIKHIERGARRHFHDDITVVVVYLDHHKHSVRPKLCNRNSFMFTNAPVDIFSGSSDDVDHHPLRLNLAMDGAVG